MLPSGTSPKLEAWEVKNTLRLRHPALDYLDRTVVGRWVTLEEWENIDLLALDAWRAAQRIGYEVKVSRADYRAELMKPSKRVKAVSMCTQFYFAVPYDLLKPEEIAFEPLDWAPEDYERGHCTNPQCRFWEGHPHYVHRRLKRSKTPQPRGSRLKGTEREGVSVNVLVTTRSGRRLYGGAPACCYICKGRGHVEKSKVELESPVQLWVPSDVGLIMVGRRDSEVIKRAPKRKPVQLVKSDYDLHQLVRWASMRPDPRHSGT